MYLKYLPVSHGQSNFDGGERDEEKFVTELVAMTDNARLVALR